MTSWMWGTLVMVTSSSSSSEAIITFRETFFAPDRVTFPCNFFPPRTISEFSIPLAMFILYDSDFFLKLDTKLFFHSLFDQAKERKEVFRISLPFIDNKIGVSW